SSAGAGLESAVTFRRLAAVLALLPSLASATPPPPKTASAPRNAPPAWVQPRRSALREPALGASGPIGAYGPLGTLAPIGERSWSSSRLMRSAGDWSAWSRELSRKGGPLSSFGPLGPKGPLGEKYARFPREYRAGGDWAVLGPTGPLGVLGPLGPLGPV